MFRYISFNDSSNKARCDLPVNWDLRLDQNESLDRGTVTLKQTDENCWVRKCFRYPLQERSVNASKFSVKEPVMFIAWGERWVGGESEDLVVSLYNWPDSPENHAIQPQNPPTCAPSFSSVSSSPPPSTSGNNWWLVPCKSEVIDLGSFVNREFSVLT